MNITEIQALDGYQHWKYFDLPYQCHLTIRLKRTASSIRVHQDLIRSLFNPLSKSLGVKMVAVSAILTDHVHSLLVFPEEQPNLEDIQIYCSKRGSDIVAKAINPNTKGYVFEHLVRQDASPHCYNYNYLRNQGGTA